MNNKIKIDFDFEGEVADDLMKFVFDTQDGKYTEEKPILTQITYKRIDLVEQDYASSIDESGENIILFGVSS